MLSPIPSPDALRFLWRLQGPVAERSVFVVGSWETQDPPRKPLATWENLTGEIAWHAISQQPLAEPKMKSISVHIDVLERWQRKWIEWHERHASPDDDDCIYRELLDGLLYKSEGSSSSSEEGEVEDDEGELIRCCGSDRPERALPLVIEASNKEYITIHDYVSTLRPWLMGYGRASHGMIT